MSSFSENEINELLEIARERKRSKEREALMSAEFHALTCILGLINKSQVLEELKKVCAEHNTISDLQVELCTFEKCNGSRKNKINRVYDWIYILKKTDILQRLSNILGPGHFSCTYKVRDGIIYVFANFYLKKIQPKELSCLPHDGISEGLCTLCGSYKII